MISAELARLPTLRHVFTTTWGMRAGGPVVAESFAMTRNLTAQRPRASVVRRARPAGITSLGFTMFHFEGEWPVVVLSSRNAMSAFFSL
ncbi:MAG TPA: hypothetical protein VGM39_20120 [Kofleriaceae bacterium]